ncbi:NlpC/P60 family protein [Candidatus Frankia nodulisporulans]|nr:bifunctional lytic transglycosylase/C40 family peptidase [Candidatus Frankia nodulisporulans]
MASTPGRGSPVLALAAVALVAVCTVIAGALAIFGGALSGDGQDDDGQAGQGGLGAGAVPAVYVGGILSAGRACATLTPGILAAQLEAESGFDPTARSPVGAQGIAQFMPATWATHGRDGDGDGRADVDNPADAIPAAAAYDCALAAAVAAIPGDPAKLMLAAYNAGPGAVLTNHGVPPYAETQSYVARILARAPTLAAALTAESTPVGVTNKVMQTALAFARAQLGKPYTLGANGPDTWDCSSLVQAAYEAAGVSLPRTTFDQVDASGPVIALTPVSAWQPGDLLFAAGSDGSPTNPGHVGIYLGNNEVLHAPHTGDVVKIVTLDHYEKVTGVTRPAALAR